MKDDLIRFARYLIVGGINTGFGYASYAALILLGLPIWAAVAGSTLLSIVFNFFSYGSLVFQDTAHRRLPKFLAVYAVLGLLNYLALKGLTQAGLGPLLAQAVLVPLLAIAGYCGMRFFVFENGVSDGRFDRQG
jgi:putative flippase GtrA